MGKSWRNSGGCVAVIAILCALGVCRHLCAQTLPMHESEADVYRGFRTPPAEARPMVRWWWFGVAVKKPEILRELEQMKADGIGGAELAFVYPMVVDDPAKGLINLPFLSPAMLDDVRYAQAQGRRLGLRMDVTLCSGWPYGGPATSLAESAERLKTFQLPLPAGQTEITLPSLGEGESPLSISVVKGSPGHWDASTEQKVQLDGQSVHLSRVDYDRTILFFVEAHTHQKVKRAAVGAEGYVLDPFSPKAVATHLSRVGEPLLHAFGSTPPYAIFSDSLETYGADWTPNLPAEFKKRMGYDLIPHLPELLDGGSTAAQKVRHDYGVTLTDLVNTSYLKQINQWAIAHHTRFRSQTYGTPAVSFSSQSLVALPEGEGPQWRRFSTLRWATSANHVFGNKVTSGESFTWLHSPVFRATPLDMKAEADIDFITGENQFIFHGWPYSPPQVSEPGWSLYAAAALNNHNPWHPVMPYVTQYIARLSYVLRQGMPANQIAILLPTDDAWASFSLGKVSVTDMMVKLIPPSMTESLLSAGYNYDFIDADAIDASGVGHPILVLPPTDRIPPATLTKIAAFVAGGGKLITVGRTPTMSPEGNPLSIPTVCTHSTVSQRSECHPLFNQASSTMVAQPSELGGALLKASSPDLRIDDADANTKNAIGFIRRKLDAMDVYFVVNTSNKPLHFAASFNTNHQTGEEWNLNTADITGASTTRQSVELAPYQSRMYIFSDKKENASPPASSMPLKPVVDLSTNWKVRFPQIDKSFDEATLTNWVDDPTTLHYSGVGIYTRTFDMPDSPVKQPILFVIKGGKPTEDDQPETSAPLPGAVHTKTRTGPGIHAYYDPPIREAALLRVNGHNVGALWHPPYAVDITKYLVRGKNNIEIRVYNTALNAWSALPPHNFSDVIAKYGDRFQMQDMDKIRPISSGLLGTVELMSAENP